MRTEAHFAVMLFIGIALGSFIKPRNLPTLPSRTALLLFLSRLLIGITGAVIVGHLAWGLGWYSTPGDLREVASSAGGAALLLSAYSRTLRAFKRPRALASQPHLPMQKRRKMASSTSSEALSPRISLIASRASPISPETTSSVLDSDADSASPRCSDSRPRAS